MTKPPVQHANISPATQAGLGQRHGQSSTQRLEANSLLLDNWLQFAITPTTMRQLVPTSRNNGQALSYSQFFLLIWNITCTYIDSSDESSSSIMAAAVADEDCDPFTSREMPCKAGDSVTYSVKATDAMDIMKTLAFARANNIRLVIRNTGHELVTPK